MENQKSAKELILETLKTKACLKQKVFKSTIEIFQNFKDEAKSLIEDLKAEMNIVDKAVVIDFIDKGNYEFHIKFGGDRKTHV